MFLGKHKRLGFMTLLQWEKNRCQVNSCLGSDDGP